MTDDAVSATYTWTESEFQPFLRAQQIALSQAKNASNHLFRHKIIQHLQVAGTAGFATLIFALFLVIDIGGIGQFAKAAHLPWVFLLVLAATFLNVKLIHLLARKNQNNMLRPYFDRLVGIEYTVRFDKNGSALESNARKYFFAWSQEKFFIEASTQHLLIVTNDMVYVIPANTLNMPVLSAMTQIQTWRDAAIAN